MTFALIGCFAGIFVVEMLGATFCRTRIKKKQCGDGVAMSCNIDGHVYVVHAPTREQAMQAWAAYAADPECNFTWFDASKMNRLTAEFFACKHMNRRAK